MLAKSHLCKEYCLIISAFFKICQICYLVPIFKLLYILKVVKLEDNSEIDIFLNNFFIILCDLSYVRGALTLDFSILKIHQIFYFEYIFLFYFVFIKTWKYFRITQFSFTYIFIIMLLKPLLCDDRWLITFSIFKIRQTWVMVSSFSSFYFIKIWRYLEHR